MSYKEICCVTGSRAEYGIFRPLLSKFLDSSHFNLDLVVTGSHFSKQYGNSIDEIRNKFTVAKEMNFFNEVNDSQIVKINEMSSIQNEFTKYLLEKKTDLVIVIGDRYEILPVATAAYMLSVPIAHIHGGEQTLGSLDDGIRHAITQLSTIHFTSTEEYALRVIKMGADSNNVHNVGALGVERVIQHNFSNKSDVEKKLGFKFGKKNAICTFHPPTLESIDVNLFFENFISIIKAYDNFNIIFTGSNADLGGSKINRMLINYSKENTNFCYRASLGESLFLDVLNNVDFIIGNSSSAFLEAPALKKPSINIGRRQDGRIAPKNIINAGTSHKSLDSAINKALKMSSENSLKDMSNPYGNGTASNQIVNILLDKGS